MQRTRHWPILFELGRLRQEKKVEASLRDMMRL